MELEEFEKIIKKIYKYTKLVCLHVKGEPLLHRQLEQILEILEKYNLKVNITTNGTLIKNNIEILIKSKALRQINFSIHSIKENKFINKQYLQDIFECSEKLDNTIISYRLWNLKNIRENDINSSIIEEIEKYYNIPNLKQQLIENEFLEIKKNMFINQDIEFIWPNSNQNIIIEKGRCLALKDQIAILVDGTVVPCCLDNNGDIPLGNIFQETLEQILEKTKTVTIKKNFENGVITCELCKRCGFLKRLESKRK